MRTTTWRRRAIYLERTTLGPLRQALMHATLMAEVEPEAAARGLLPAARRAVAELRKATSRRPA